MTGCFSNSSLGRRGHLASEHSSSLKTFGIFWKQSTPIQNGKNGSVFFKPIWRCLQMAQKSIRNTSFSFIDRAKPYGKFAVSAMTHQFGFLAVLRTRMCSLQPASQFASIWVDGSHAHGEM